MLEKVAQHTVIYALGNIGIRAASFLLIPFFTRTLPQDEFGQLAVLLSANQVLLVLMSVGMRDAIVRFFKESKNSRSLDELLGVCLLVSILSGLVVTGLMVFPMAGVFRELLHATHVTRYLLLISLATLAQSLCLELMSCYRADGRPVAFLVAGIATAVLLFLLNVLFLGVFKLGVTGALMAYVATYGIACAAILLHVGRSIGLACSSIHLKKCLRFGLPLMLLQASACVILDLPVFFLSNYHGTETVAVYSVGQKIAHLLVPFLVLPFQQALEPMVYGNLDDKELPAKLSKMLTYFVFAFLVGAFGFMVISRPLLFISAPSNYGGAEIVLAGLLPATFLLGLGNIGRIQLHIRLKTNISAAVAIVTAVVSILLYSILIQRFAIHGVLIAVNAVWLLQASAILFFGYRTFRIPLDVRRLALAVGAFLLVCALFAVSGHLSNLWFYLANAVLFLAAVAILRWTSFLTDEEKQGIASLLQRCRAFVSA